MARSARSARHVPAEREPGVERGRRGGAPAEEVRPALGRHAQQVGDDQHRQLRGVGLDEVDRARCVSSSASSRASAVRWTTGSSAAVARGVNDRLTRRRKRVWSGGSTDEHGRRLGHARWRRARRRSAAPSGSAAGACRPVPARHRSCSERRISEATACDAVTSPRLPADSGRGRGAPRRAAYGSSRTARVAQQAADAGHRDGRPARGRRPAGRAERPSGRRCGPVAGRSRPHRRSRRSGAVLARQCVSADAVRRCVPARRDGVRSPQAWSVGAGA